MIFDDDFELAVEPPKKPVMDSAIANEQAFYTADSMDAPEEHTGIKNELENAGVNEFHDAANENWRKSQEATDNNIVMESIQDSNITLEDRAQLFKLHTGSTFASTNIRDAFIQEQASVTVQPVDKADQPVRQVDIEAQDLYIDTVEMRKDAHNELQRMQTGWQADLDPSISSVIGGLLHDFSPFVLPNFRSASAALEAGLTLDPSESASATADFVAAVGATFLATGSVNKKVADAFRDAPPEQKQQIFKDVVAGLERVPGTDFNKFIAMQELIEQPLDDAAFTAVRDLFGILEALPFGQLVTNPLKTIRWYSTFKNRAGLTPGDVVDEADFLSRGVPDEFGAGVAPGATVSKDAAGNQFVQLDTFLPRHNAILPAPKPKKSTASTPESAQPNMGTIILDDKTLKQEFPNRHPDIETEYLTPSTGYAKGNMTDTPVGVDDSTDLITAERVAEDFVAGQNYGEQQWARNLLKLAKDVPTAENNQILLDELWQASGGATGVPLDEFKRILLDLHNKGSIKLGTSAKELTVNKAKGAQIKGRNDETFDTLTFDIPAKRTISDDLDKFDEFGENLTTAAKIDKILARSSEIPEDIIKRRTSKVYSSSFENKAAGQALVRVNSAKFDALFSRAANYVGANGVGGNAKKYREAKEFFNETKNIEVGSVKVDDAGVVSFVDGKHRHAVIRDSGVKSIPVSMDAQSIRNAQKHGILDGVAKESTRRSVNSNPATIARSAVPDVPANSPYGTLAIANPVAASNKAVEILADLEGDIAHKMGTTRAAVYGQGVLPKIQKSVVEQFPGVANKLKVLDENFEVSFREGSFDNHITPSEVLNREVDLVVDTLREIKNVTYQQSNSTIDFGREQAHGLGQYGRTEDSGWNDLQDASDAWDQVKGANPNFPTRIIQKDTQYFIEQEWEATFNHLDRFMFGLHSLQANFLGIDVSSVARSKLGDIFIPFSMSDGTPDLRRVGGGAIKEMKANKIQQEFVRTINQVVLDRGMPLKELHTELRNVQESQEWLTLGQLNQSNSHLTPKKFEKLVQGYEAYRRLSDFNYEWVNRIDRNDALENGHKGIYNENGALVALGSDKFPKEALTNGDIREVWSLEKNAAVPLPTNLEGSEVLLARAPLKNERGEILDYVLVGGKFEKGLLPSRTLPRTEGWVARKNVENWYVDAVPRTAKVNGNAVDSLSEAGAAKLRQYKKTIGAGMTKPEAIKLMAKLSKEPEFINSSMEIRAARENQGSASVADYTFFSETVKSSKKRGARLPTLNGHAKLEDSVEALAQAQKNAIKIQVDRDYNRDYESGFMEAFGKFTEGTFPTHPAQIMERTGSPTELDLKELKVAQTLFRWYEGINNIKTTGDNMWANFWHKAADNFENMKLGGAQAAEASRWAARQGNMGVRVSKSVATTLMIHTNPARQWMIQPQQLIEFNAISPNYRKRAIMEIPAHITAMLSRADIIPGGGDAMLYNSARTLSGMEPAEFDKVHNALWGVGIPQAVDMNSMLLGGLSSGKFNIDPNAFQQSMDLLTSIVKAPGLIGKSIGFTPAELANITGTWLYTLDRFKNNNPGVDWNTPTHLNTITKQAWDISHSMIGNAGSAPWQKGAVGLFLQFAAVQHRGMMQVLMSKTLTPEERWKFSAARLAIYGAHGLPFLALSGAAIVNEFGSEDFKKEYPKMKGGLADIGTNALVDLWLQDPDNVSDFSISEAITPISEDHPFIQLFIEGKRLVFQEGGAPNPRFPAIQAVGSVYEAMADIHDIYTVLDLSTEEKLTAWIPEVAEMFSGYNNYAKASLLRNINDKKNARGQWLGLEANEAAAYFQLFGFTTRQEVDGYLLNDVTREQAEFVQEAARDIADTLEKIDNKFGTPDWDERKRRMKVLLTGVSHDKALQRSISTAVDQMQLSQAKRGSFRDTLYFNLAKFYGDRNTKAFNEGMDILRRSAETNPKDREVLERFEDMLNTRLSKEELTFDHKGNNTFQAAPTDKEDL